LEKNYRTKGVLTLDPICLSCTNNQTNLIKSFKMACLAYDPSNVIYRNVEFKRE
jgi:hypothetical protein